MSGIKNINRINSDRLSTMYVERKNSVENINVVSPVDAVEKTHNDSGNPNENFLFSSNQFYENLSSLKEEYKRFYNDEQNLEKALKEFEDGDIILFGQTKDLIEKYNSAAASLKILDDALEMDYFKGIYTLLSDFETNLKSLGITVKNGYWLQIDENEFREMVMESKDAADCVETPKTG